MVRFDELQELWQNQQTPFRPAVDTVSLTRGFRNFGRRQNAINAAKLALILVQVGWMFFTLRRVGALALTGAAFIAAGEAVFLALDWRSQFGIARSTFANPSVVFIEGTIERLRRQRRPLSGYLWILLLSITCGLNLILWDSRPHGAPLRTLKVHAGFTGFALICYRFGLWIRSRRFESECRPLIAQLTAMRQELEERSQ
jgi:hypothetical protein